MPYTVQEIIDKLRELYKADDILLIDWWDIKNVRLLAEGLDLDLTSDQQEEIFKEVIDHFKDGLDNRDAVFSAIVTALKHHYPQCHKIQLSSDIKLTDEVEIFLNGIELER